MINVCALYVYPVKSCAGTRLEVADTNPRGIIHDRGWMLVNAEDRFLTQRQYPRMALITPRVEKERSLRLSAPGMRELVVPGNGGGPMRQVKVWRDTCQAVDQGDEVAEWLSTFLNLKCRLVSMADDFARRVDPDYARTPEDQVGFADAFPYLVTSTASLRDLNNRLARPLPMDRFRPNIVVEGSEAFAEDRWNEIAIGEMTFSVVKSCARCPITTIDQSTAERGQEPLKTLAEFRNFPGGIMFGQNLVAHDSGRLRVGDAVSVLS